MIKHLKGLEINSIYDFDNAFSINELLCKFWEKIEETINISNESIDILNWVKEQGVSDELLKLLTEWKDNGTLDTIINSKIFNELNTKIDSFQEEVNTEVDNFQTDVNNKVNTFKNEVNTNFDVMETEFNNKVNESISNIETTKQELNNTFNEQKIKLENIVKKIDKFSEIHYINTNADELSILIKCMNGEVVLIDCGEAFSANKIKERLDNLKVTEINHFIITHFHSDHAGSYETILNNYWVNNVYYKPITWALSQKEIGWLTPNIYNSFLTKVEQLGIHSHALNQDLTITINEYEKIKLLNTSPYPYTDKSATTDYSVYDYNYESLMCYYTNGTTKVLFQGDCPSQVAYENYGTNIKNLDHLQISHHGGIDVLKKEWTQSVRPKTAFYTNTIFNTAEHYKAYTLTKLYSYDCNTTTSGCVLVTPGSLTTTSSMLEQTQGDRFINMEGELWVYVNSAGDIVENGIITNNGKMYIIKDWYKQLPSPDGWCYAISGQAYALNSDGSIKCNQWVTTSGNNYYVNDQGIFIKNGIYKVGTTDVTFDSEGCADI